MSFEENSYLGKQIEEIRNDFIRKKEKEIYELNCLNKDLNNILYNLRYTDEFEKDNILLGLLCNIIETYNSIVILSNYGLSSNAQVLLRALTENVFNYCAIIRDKSYLEHFIDKGNGETKRLAILIEKNPNTFLQKELFEQIDNLKKDSELYDKKYGYMKIEDIAIKANLHDVFLYTYNILCLETHGNIKSIVRNHIHYKEERVTLNMLPSYNEHRYIVTTTMYVLVQIMICTQEYFDCDIQEKIDRYYEFIKNFDSRL